MGSLGQQWKGLEVTSQWTAYHFSPSCTFSEVHELLGKKENSSSKEVGTPAFGHKDGS